MRDQFYNVKIKGKSDEIANLRIGWSAHPQIWEVSKNKQVDLDSIFLLNYTASTSLHKLAKYFAFGQTHPDSDHSLDS